MAYVIKAGIPEGLTLFSRNFKGSKESWEWICAKTNNRAADKIFLSDEQLQYAYVHGYLDDTVININDWITKQKEI